MRDDGSVVRHRHSLAPAETFPAVRSAADQRRSAPTAALAAKRRTVPASSRGCSPRARSTMPPTPSAAPPTTTPSAPSSGSAARRKLGARGGRQDARGRRRARPADRLAPGALFLTLQRNREWWTTGRCWARAGASASPAPRSSGSTTPAPASRSRCSAPSARSTRSGPRARRPRSARPSTSCCRSPPSAPAALAWEYYFHYRAGKAPWVSSLAQGTALQALSRAAPAAAPPGRGVPVHEPRPRRSSRPGARGRARPGRRGAHYAQYSFEPGLRILNGFIQSLVGLYDYGRIAADDRAQALFAAGEARAREEVPTYDTGRLVAVLARDGHARVRPRLPHAAARLPRVAVQPHAERASTAAPRSASRPT